MSEALGHDRGLMSWCPKMGWYESMETSIKYNLQVSEIETPPVLIAQSGFIDRIVTALNRACK